MGILIRNNIVNQKGNPAWYEDTLANRPTANLQGRMFIDTDVPSTGIYRDNGTSWDQVADPGAGTTGTLQQVTTNGSSTNIGISVSTNGIGIGTTIPGINRLDIHTATGINATFNGTGTTNAALQLQLAGVGKWNVTNKYNSAANDFAITDVLNSLDRLTIKNTGQTFIGSTTTSSGSFVVNNATSDNHIVVLGANGPSLRFRNAGTGGTLNTGLGISTAANNFIQGSASGDYCIFNSSTTASPILFGVYDSGSGNTTEAARISAARNLLVGTVTDGGYKLSVSGTANISGAVNVNSLLSKGTIQLGETSNTTANIQLLLSNYSTVNSYPTLLFQTPSGSYFSGIGINTSNDLVIGRSSALNGNFTFQDLKISNTTGAATFTSSIAINNTVTAAVAVASTHKVTILIGGVTYYLLASNI